MSALAPRRRPAAATLALAVTGLALLAGCTATTGPDDAAPSSAETPRAAAAETGTCTDGFMLVDTGTGPDAALETDADADATTEADSPVAVEDADCDLVSVVGSGGTVELGTVGTLVVEGTGVAVSVDEVTTVRLAGDDDVVTHGGAAPTVEDAGERNSVAPAA
jgi:hypothetical protein